MTNDRLAQLWAMQEQFTRKFWDGQGGMPKPEELARVTKDYLIHLQREGMEVLDEVPWKMHRVADAGPIDRSNVLEELTDCQKYLWGLMQVWGFSVEDMASEFRRKSMVVEQRYQQERDLAKLEAHPVAVVDIDGVLADYPRGFYQWIAQNVKQRDSVASARQWYESLSLALRDEVKTAYRMSGAKATLPVLRGAKELLELVRARGLKVVLLTNRPYHRHYRIYPDTLEWLATNGLEYDAILWAADKGLEVVRRFKNVCWAVDDNPSNVARLREAGINVIQVDPGDEGRDTDRLYSVAARCEKIDDLYYTWKEGAK